MFTSILETISETSYTMTVQQAVMCMVCALVLGFIIAGVYMFCGDHSPDFVITLVILPVLVQGVIIMVNGNLGTSVAVLGAFSLVRFRSFPGSSRDIVSIFFAMAVGLAAGMGQVAYAVLLTAGVSVILILLHFARFGEGRGEVHELKITIPESLDYTEVFDDVFEKYLSKYDLARVKTSNLGTMYELYYKIKMKDQSRQKEMIDDLRCRNGNLTISCSRPRYNAEAL